MTRIQARERIRKTNKHLKLMLKNGDFKKYSEEQLERILSFGLLKWKDTFNPQRAYN